MDIFPDIGAPDWGLTENPEASVTTISFGDGYELRQADGINHLRDRWDPVWSFLSPAEALSTYNWLKSRLSLTAFLWNHPDGRQVKVVCKSVSLAHNNYNDDVLSASFVQDFNP